ncbi:MAG: alpha/beta fold hydrolase [Pseudomonadota bacterium]
MSRLAYLRGIIGVVAAALLAWSISVLEGEMQGLAIEPLDVGTTPATVYRDPDVTSAPIVVIAHGFAGSQQLMKAYALTLAKARYIAVTFDFEGHGANPVPMSGDVTSVDGTTQRLVNETLRVMDAARAEFDLSDRMVLLGHSMATDIIVRAAQADGDVEAVVGVSTFSQAIDRDSPENLLLIVGQWEGMLREEALRVVQLIDRSAQEGEMVGSFANGSARKVFVVPQAEHVAVLYAPSALQEAREWIDDVFDTVRWEGPVPELGLPIIALLAGLVGLIWPLSQALPALALRVPEQRMSVRRFIGVVLLVAVLTPILVAQFNTRFLPVLVADYLSVHLFVYGVAALFFLFFSGAVSPRGMLFSVMFGLLVAAYGVLAFGFGLDSYVASFSAIDARLPIIAIIAVGAIPFMIADAALTERGHAPLWRTLFARGMFLVSLSIAVALDFERLFFLLLIMIVILLFFVVFGTLGGVVGRRTGLAGIPGVGNGITLAWALGVTFPLFAA